LVLILELSTSLHCAIQNQKHYIWHAKWRLNRPMQNEKPNNAARITISFYLWWVLRDGIEYMNISVLESISKLTNPTLNHAAKNQNITGHKNQFQESLVMLVNEVANI
jgi:hypothetical protein